MLTCNICHINAQHTRMWNHGLCCDDQTLFPPATDKSSSRIWRQARRFLLFRFIWGCVFWTGSGSEVISAGHRKSRFHRRAWKLDNLFNFAALFSHASSLIPFKQRAFKINWHFCWGAGFLCEISAGFANILNPSEAYVAGRAKEKSILRRLQRLREDTLIDIFGISVG